MNPGDLRTSVVIQQKIVTSRNSSGEDVFTWTTVATLWCDVRPMSGRELEAAQQIHAEARWKIKTHYPSVTIKRAMRAVIGTRILDILDAEDPGNKEREFVMIAKEWVE
jgi:SPP1 family predicted phage head-tail adaptor